MLTNLIETIGWYLDKYGFQIIMMAMLFGIFMKFIEELYI